MCLEVADGRWPKARVALKPNVWSGMDRRWPVRLLSTGLMIPVTTGAIRYFGRTHSTNATLGAGSFLLLVDVLLIAVLLRSFSNGFDDGQ